MTLSELSLIDLPSPLVQPQILLAPHTTFRVGGLAEWYAEPRSTAELQQCLEWASRTEVSVTVLGAGSNLLISDQGLPGLVISTRKVTGIQWQEAGLLWVAAGESLVKLARQVAQQGCSGLEWAIGIPGTVGGGVVMNAGAHGQSMSSCVTAIDIIDETGQLLRLDPAQLQFSYRSSLLQHRKWIVLGAGFQLQPDQDPQQVMAQTQANWEQRRQSQPYDWPSCGSVFRNPQPQTAGWLIEQTGLKGYWMGGAQVAERHANFILNRSQAKAADIFRLIRHIQEQVDQKWSLLLEPEVRILGEFGLS